VQEKTISQLRAQVDFATNNNVQVGELQEKLKVYKSSAIEDWLFYGDLAEA
jgi:hypothetical protein